MIKWAIIGTLMFIAWAIQARINLHDRLGNEVFEALGFRKLYLNVAARHLEAGSGEVEMGEKNFRIRVVSFLKDNYSNGQMRKILRKTVDDPLAAQTETIKTREDVKEIAKQVAKSYAAMLRTPDAEVPIRRRRRGR